MSAYAPDAVSAAAARAGRWIYPEIDRITVSEHAHFVHNRVNDMFEGAQIMAGDHGDDRAWLDYLQETCDAIYMDYLLRRAGPAFAEQYWARRTATPEDL